MAWRIKGVNRYASAAFAPDGTYMAAGTMAGAVDLQFSSSANLDIFELDFVSDDRQLILAGTAPSSERFNRISWGKGPSNSEEYSLGLIAGGLVDGNIGLWNSKPLICPDTSKKVTSENAFVGNLSRHRGPVRGLEFNSLSPNLLASGADEGDICIWDVSKPSEPTHFPPLKGSGSVTQGEISFLSWNSKVQHILASTSFNGTTVVWDLKKQKPVISFSDSIRRRCSVMQWNPDVATQLIVASDEDSSPTLRLWDMRNIMTPVKEFVGHTKGVIAMSWCPIDSSNLLSCAKDNRTICWDTVSGEIVAELPAGTNWNFDVHWYSKIPGVVSASSFDGKIGIYNIEGCGRYGAGESDFVAVSESDPGDLWCDDGSSCEGSIEKSNLSSDMDREWQRRRNQFHTIGYRDGLIAGKETSAQEGFSIGFRESVLIGYDWGLVRGITSAMALLPDELKEKLVETGETRTEFQRLHKSVHSLSTTDALKLFYEGQKRKSGNQNENAEPSSNVADLNHQNPDVSVFQNYYGEV